MATNLTYNRSTRHITSHIISTDWSVGPSYWAMIGFILLKTVKNAQLGEKQAEKVKKGELLVDVPKEERHDAPQPTHNYRLYKNPFVTLYDDGYGVAPLDERELECLAATDDPEIRMEQYKIQDKLSWVTSLEVNADRVLFKLEFLIEVTLKGSVAVDTVTEGKIRYRGCIPKHDGMTMFGIEIVVSHKVHACSHVRSGSSLAD